MGVALAVRRIRNLDFNFYFNFHSPKREPGLSRTLQGTSGNLLWKWGAEKIPAGEAINAKLSGDSGRFSNEDSGDF
ncbi:MAG: hypothetical protein ACI8XO_004824, partial [Verrucomicrobiales bacterium]